MQLPFLHNTNIDFIGKRYLFFAVSIALFIVGAASLIIRGGPNYGIDFSGGILMQASFTPAVSLDQVRKALEAGGIERPELQSSKNSVIVRVKQTEVDENAFTAKVKEAFTKGLPGNAFTIDRVEFVGPSVGRHLGTQALYAVLLSFLGIIIYVAFRFHSSIWGAAGVVGIMHDVFVVFGIFALLNKEINLTSIAAFLTIAGYSINDTIVVFDRIRENLRYLTKEDLSTIVNRSVNATLSRTIITSLTVFVVACALFFLGGEVIHDFAFAMMLGVVIGTYSSIYVCSPLVVEWEMYKQKRAKLMARR